MGWTGTPSTRNCMPETITLSPCLETAQDGIIIADGIAKGDRSLFGNSALLTLRHNINKSLAADAAHCQHRNSWGRAVLQTTRAFTNWALRNLSSEL